MDEAKRARAKQLLAELKARGYSDDDIRGYIQQKREAKEYGPEGKPSWLTPGAPEKREWGDGNLTQEEIAQLKNRVGDPSLMAGLKRAGSTLAAFPGQFVESPMNAIEGLAEGALSGMSFGASRLSPDQVAYARERLASGRLGPIESALLRDELKHQDAIKGQEGAQMLGEIGGGFVGPGAAVARGIGRALPEATAAGRVMRAGTAAAGGGAVEGAGRALVAGASPLDALIASGDAAALGAALGLGGQAVGEGIGAAARGADPWIRRLSEARQSGATANPEIQALPGGKEGVIAASRRARDQILSRDAALTEQTRGAYRQAVDPELNAIVDTGPIRQRLNEAIAANKTSSGELLNPAIEKTADRVSRAISGGKPKRPLGTAYFSREGEGYYHTGLSRIKRLGPDTSLALEETASTPYIGGNRGFIHRVTLDKGAKIADERALRAAAKDLGITDGYVYELADSSKVREALRTRGYDAIEYRDLAPDNAFEHDTLRVINPNKTKIVGVARVDRKGNIKRPRSQKPSATATTDDLLRVRKMLDEDAGFGAPAPSSSQRAARVARSAVRRGIREASPTVAEADDAFAAFARQQNRRSDILTGRESGMRTADAPEPDASAASSIRGRVPDEVAIASRLARLGDTTEEGLRLAPYMEELAAQDPIFQRALNELMAKKAIEATRFGGGGAIQDNLSQVGQKGWLGGLWGPARQQARALGAQAERAGTSTGNTGNPIVRAVEADRQRNRDRARKVRR